MLPWLTHVLWAHFCGAGVRTGISVGPPLLLRGLPCRERGDPEGVSQVEGSQDHPSLGSLARLDRAGQGDSRDAWPKGLQYPRETGVGGVQWEGSVQTSWAGGPGLVALAGVGGLWVLTQAPDLHTAAAGWAEPEAHGHFCGVGGLGTQGGREAQGRETGCLPALPGASFLLVPSSCPPHPSPAALIATSCKEKPQTPELWG